MTSPYAYWVHRVAGLSLLFACAADAKPSATLAPKGTEIHLASDKHVYRDEIRRL